MTEASKDGSKLLKKLEASIDEYAGVFKKLRGASSLEAYLSAPGDRADEEILTEPILRSLIERLLGFPRGAYLEQLGKSGRKPDFTPDDLIAHPFVLDAKSSDESLAKHEPQIRAYMDQRQLDFGILFNLREMQVFRRTSSGHDPELSFPILPLWQEARGEALPGDEHARFEAFCATFGYREMSLAEKIEHISTQQPWSSRLQTDEVFVIDVEALVERLRRLSRALADDASAQIEDLDEYVGFDEVRERKLVEELELLALDIAPGTDATLLPKTLEEWRTTPGLAANVWRQYLLRVAYLSLTRILLYRAWEDVEFVESYLYDGGFDVWYEQLGNNVRKLLDEAFLHGGQRYPWLFGRENNYDWYHPRETVLVDVLYALAPQPLGRLDADVLGSLYATYVEDIDRDRLGQFFTPRDVVRFMLDRVGFSSPEGVFRIEGGERKPLRVLDFATGSGGFLVEAARRIIDAVGAEKGKPRDLHDALRAIVAGFSGGEISPFPYYLTEINLLLQVSRLLGPLHAAEDRALPNFGALGVLPIDTLTAKSTRSLDDFDPDVTVEVVDDERYGLVPLDGRKLEIYRERLRPDEYFDFVVGNPPYVAEAGNKPLFDRLRAIPAWGGIYKGKTDYLYYFLWLAIEKLAPGGRLCVITPAGWMNASEADFLREKLTAELTLEELFLFGSYRVFATEDAAPTPTVESAILVAKKLPAPRGHKLRVVALEDETQATADRHELLEEMRIRAGSRAGRRGGIHVHDLLQRSLQPEYPWPVKFGAKDVATRVVAHLQSMLDNEASTIESLDRRWFVFQGIKTAADAYSVRVQRRLSPTVRERLHADGARTGDPIMELPPGRETEVPWSNHPELLAQSPEPQAILYGAVDPDNYTNLVWTDADTALPLQIRQALEPWRPVLETRYDAAGREWWETARPRNRARMLAPKVIALYRTDRGRFALDETGEWQPSIKTTLVVGREPDAPVAYVCGILNSELLDLWYAVRGKRPRDIWRNYEPKRMNEMPYRPPDGDPRANKVTDLVRQIAANRRALLSHRDVFRNLDRAVKDPWLTSPVELDERGLVAKLPPEETVSLRLDEALDLDVRDHGRARVERASPETLSLRRGRQEIGRITGDMSRLNLLEIVLGGAADDGLNETLLPKDLPLFALRAEERRKLVDHLLAEGRRLVEQVERLVCALYGVPAELTEEIIAHAVARAGGNAI